MKIWDHSYSESLPDPLSLRGKSFNFEEIVSEWEWGLVSHIPHLILSVLSRLNLNLPGRDMIEEEDRYFSDKSSWERFIDASDPDKLRYYIKILLPFQKSQFMNLP